MIGINFKTQFVLVYNFFLEFKKIKTSIFQSLEIILEIKKIKNAVFSRIYEKNVKKRKFFI